MLLGHTEILIIAGVVVLLFGATALPKLARSIGKAKREFQKGMREDPEDDAHGHREHKGQDDGAGGQAKGDVEPLARRQGATDAQQDPDGAFSRRIPTLCGSHPDEIEGLT